MRKVFEIKVANSASFYSYLALSGIDFKTKEKSDVIIFTCDMTDAEFAAAVQYCNKLAEICVKTIKKTTLEFILTKKEIIDIVTKIGFDAMMNNDRLKEILLPGWDKSLYKIQ